MPVIEHHYYKLLSLASGDYLPERYATYSDAKHAHRTLFGAARQGAYQVVRFPTYAPDPDPGIVPVIDGHELFGGPDA